MSRESLQPKGNDIRRTAGIVDSMSTTVFARYFDVVRCEGSEVASELSHTLFRPGGSFFLRSTPLGCEEGKRVKYLEHTEGYGCGCASGEDV